MGKPRQKEGGKNEREESDHRGAYASPVQNVGIVSPSFLTFLMMAGHYPPELLGQLRGPKNTLKSKTSSRKAVYRGLSFSALKKLESHDGGRIILLRIWNRQKHRHTPRPQWGKGA